MTISVPSGRLTVPARQTTGWTHGDMCEEPQHTAGLRLHSLLCQQARARRVGSPHTLWNVPFSQRNASFQLWPQHAPVTSAVRKKNCGL